MSETRRLLRIRRHGHVGYAALHPGSVQPCGGLLGCTFCRAELLQEVGKTHADWLFEAADLNAVGTPTAVMLWACRTRELAGELGKVTSCLRDVVEDVRQVMPAQIYGTALYESFARARRLLLDETKEGA